MSEKPTDNTVISRAQARERGLEFYFTGRTCKRGHIARRRTPNGSCVPCSREAARRWCRDNPERHRENCRRAAAANPERARERDRRWRENNPERAREIYREKDRRWRKANPERHCENVRRWQAENREQVREGVRRWRANNPEKVCAQAKARNKRVRLATPPWADMDAIRAFYLACPKGMDVDHIVPLRGKNICGLHVLGNLQYLDHIENIKKGNRWDG